MIYLLGSLVINADVKSPTDELNFVLDDDVKMKLTDRGLGIGTTPSANLTVQGNAIVTETLFLGSDTGGANFNLNGNFTHLPQTVNSNTSLENHSIVLADSSSSNIELTLPYSGNHLGKIFKIKKIHQDNSVTVIGGDNIIDLVGYIELSSGNQGTLELISGGDRWYILSAPRDEEATVTPQLIYTVSTNNYGIRTDYTGNFNVDWGDGSSEGDIQVNGSTLTLHNYASAGNYEVRISTLDAFKPYYDSDVTNHTYVTNFDVIGSPSFDNDLYRAWRGLENITSFPMIDISNVTSLFAAWYSCESLTSFPTLDTSNVTNMKRAWLGCDGLTSFPSLDTSSVTDFEEAWYNCNGWTSFPLLDTSSGITFIQTWYRNNSLTSFPSIDTSSGQDFTGAWRLCNSLTTFPSLNFNNATTLHSAWMDCSSLTTFPANVFDGSSVTELDDAFEDTALNATSIENILVSLDTAGQSGGNLDLSGGTSTAEGSWTANAATALTNLEGKGWTITRN